MLLGGTLGQKTTGIRQADPQVHQSKVTAVQKLFGKNDRVLTHPMAAKFSVRPLHLQKTVTKNLSLEKGHTKMNRKENNCPVNKGRLLMQKIL